MIVPQYWAEGRCQHRGDGRRQITVRRFGWSDVSQDEAQSNADSRAREALARLLAGEKLDKREPKISYNGAVGVPIREEIVSRYGDTSITRNAYGSRCLNTPDVLFVDIDFADGPPFSMAFAVFVLFIVGPVAVGWILDSKWYGIGFSVLGLFLFYPMSVRLHGLVLRARGGFENIAGRRVAKFISNNPDWHLRQYRTPAGLRLLAMHRTFRPQEPAVAECFRALGADPIYARMCLNQRCFRARVSPKPWRIGIGEQLRPRPGVWPIRPERMPERNRWIDAYEKVASDYASCHFVEALGNNAIDSRARCSRFA